jgi:uncharacterized DUF497 family protein
LGGESSVGRRYRGGGFFFVENMLDVLLSFGADICIVSKTENLIIGIINRKNWLAVIIYWSNIVRINSVRHSKEKEIECYES